MLEKEYCIAAKQYTERGMQLKIINTCKPELPCAPAEITLEDAYMYVMNRSLV